jgi:hypothetical protein
MQLCGVSVRCMVPCYYDCLPLAHLHPNAAVAQRLPVVHPTHIETCNSQHEKMDTWLHTRNSVGIHITIAASLYTQRMSHQA